ncbi:MAG: flagellar biosynthetic protein FliO [Mesorhizobium sp.]|nr:flagellar biosynthetic protein FliO [Mesorhizobium sp.]MBL8578853.1 flagellar biosynthetic protein FliO [Mesorhizobium sp.]
MSDWFAGVGGAEFATAVIWTLAALILLVIVLVVVRLVRSMTFGTFVAGGRNRKTRLAVMDATAVDSHRRLVLVRRDEIEHLLLIGGPTDVVVEREIRVSGGRRAQSVFGDDGEFEGQQAQVPGLPPLPTVPQAPPAPRQRAPEPIQAAPPPARAAPPQPARQPERPQPPRAPERAPPPTRPVRQTGTRPPAARDMAPPARPAPSRLPAASLPPLPAAMSSSVGRYQPAPTSNLDDALLRELEVTFDASPPPPSFDPSSFDASIFDPPAPKKAPVPVEMTLDDEMTKLLGELSNNNR